MVEEKSANVWRYGNGSLLELNVRDQRSGDRARKTGLAECSEGGRLCAGLWEPDGARTLLEQLAALDRIVAVTVEIAVALVGNRVSGVHGTTFDDLGGPTEHAKVLSYFSILHSALLWEGAFAEDSFLHATRSERLRQTQHYI